MAKLHRFIDIGANLTDSMFMGIYHGSQKHNGDLSEVLKRAWNASLDKIIVTSGCIQDVEDALMLVSSDARLYTTVGCHPTRCNEFEEHGPEKYLERLESFVSNNKSKVVALGEFGLDYDRLQFCSKEVQLKYFEMQLSLSEKFKLPLFLHCRNSASDLLDVLSRNRDKIYGGVVHSFTGTLSEAQKFIDFGLHIGINGCSLKTDENLEVVKNLPLDKLLIETDAPWCEIKPTHAGFKYIKTHFSSKKKEKFETGFCVKGRNEPALIVQILEIIAQLKSEDPFMLSKQIFENTTELFKFY